MNANPDIGQTIQSAIHRVDDTDPSDHYMAPLNHEMFYQSQEGQDHESDSPDDEPMQLKLKNFSHESNNMWEKSRHQFTPRSRSGSRSRSRSNSPSSGNEDREKESRTSDSEPEDLEMANHDSQEEDL
jgi:hypothetical protein